MSTDFQKDPLPGYLKHKIEGENATVSDAVWKGVSNHITRKKRRRIAAFWWIGFGLFLLSTGVVWLYIPGLPEGPSANSSSFRRNGHQPELSQNHYQRKKEALKHSPKIQEENPYRVSTGGGANKYKTTEKKAQKRSSSHGQWRSSFHARQDILNPLRARNKVRPQQQTTETAMPLAFAETLLNQVNDQTPTTSQELETNHLIAPNLAQKIAEENQPPDGLVSSPELADRESAGNQSKTNQPAADTSSHKDLTEPLREDTTALPPTKPDSLKSPSGKGFWLVETGPGILVAQVRIAPLSPEIEAITRILPENPIAPGIVYASQIGYVRKAKKWLLGAEMGLSSIYQQVGYRVLPGAQAGSSYTLVPGTGKIEAGYAFAPTRQTGTRISFLAEPAIRVLWPLGTSGFTLRLRYSPIKLRLGQAGNSKLNIWNKDWYFHPLQFQPGISYYSSARRYVFGEVYPVRFDSFALPMPVANTGKGVAILMGLGWRW